MTDIEKGYLAGLIDGEGSVMLMATGAGKYKVPQVSVASTDYEIMSFLKEHLGGTISKKPTYAEHHKDSWTWKVTHNKAIELLKIIEPFMLIPKKKKRARLIIEKYKEVTPRNGKYSEELLKKKMAFEKDFVEIK